MRLTLTPGTWLVVGHATLASQLACDGQQIGLYNATAKADVPSSKSGFQATDLDVTTTFTTMKVMTVAATTDIRLKAYRNGGSRPSFGAPGLTLTGAQRLMATKLQ